MSYIGNNKISGMYLGSTKIAKAYLGTDLVYQSVYVPRQYTLTKYPSSLDTDNTVVRSWASGYGDTRGFTSVSSTTEARANWVNGTNAETFVYWKFDLSEIPDNATIESITLSAKARRSAGNIVSSCYLVVCDGTTQKGTISTVSSSAASTYTLDVGSGWTGTSIKNLALLFYCKRNSVNATSTYFLGFYGATLTIKYTV